MKVERLCQELRLLRSPGPYCPGGGRCRSPSPSPRRPPVSVAVRGAGDWRGPTGPPAAWACGSRSNWRQTPGGRARPSCVRLSSMRRPDAGPGLFYSISPFWLMTDTSVMSHVRQDCVPSMIRAAGRSLFQARRLLSCPAWFSPGSPGRAALKPSRGGRCGYCRRPDAGGRWRHAHCGRPAGAPPGHRRPGKEASLPPRGDTLPVRCRGDSGTAPTDREGESHLHDSRHGPLRPGARRLSGRHRHEPQRLAGGPGLGAGGSA